MEYFLKCYQKIREIEKYLLKSMALKALKKYIHIHKYHYPTSKDMLLANAFDVVIISDILEYMPSMISAANMIRRGLGATS